MKIAFRTDASSVIGTGHVMRCLTLAEALNTECIFICRAFEGNLIKFIEEKGFKTCSLPSNKLKRADPENDKSWLCINSQTDAEETLSILNKINLNILITDHYGIDNTWEKHIKTTSPNIRLITIDDLANRKHLSDIIIDHNPYLNAISRYEKLVPKDAVKCLGSEFAMISPKFNAIRTFREKKKPQKIKDVLIYFGGADLNGTAIKVLQILKDEPYHFHICIKPQSIHYKNATQLSKDSLNITNHETSDGFFECLKHCDFAIGAGGVSSLERCFIGLPSMLICIAHNQLQICIDIAIQNGGAYYGEQETIEALSVKNFFTQLILDKHQIQHIIESGKKLFDGKGLKRLSQEILK